MPRVPLRYLKYYGCISKRCSSKVNQKSKEMNREWIEWMKEMNRMSKYQDAHLTFSSKKWGETM